MIIPNIDGHDKGFQAGYDDGRRDEKGDWILDGHGMHCGYEATAPCEDASTQTDLTASSQDRTFVENGISTCSTPTIDRSVQTSPRTLSLATSTTQTSPWIPEITEKSNFHQKKSLCALFSTTGTQTNPPKTISEATMDQFVQTNLTSTPSSCHIINLAQSSPTLAPTTPPASTSTLGTQIVHRASEHFEIGPHTRVVKSESPALPRNEKNSKFSTNATTIEISHYNTVSLPPTSSVGSPNSPALSTTFTALETRSKTAHFAPKLKKLEKSLTPSQTTTGPSSNLFEPINDAARVHATLATPYDIISCPLTSSTAASSSPLPATTRLEKGAGFGNGFENSQLNTVSDTMAFDGTVSGLESSSKVAGFAQEHSKTTIFNKIHPKMPVSEPVNWGDEANTLPIVPTYPQYPPRNLSCLRSTTPHPFSSLRRRHNHPKKRQNTKCGYGHSHSYHWHHSSHPYTPSHASLNWDRDPRLFDLSNALKALGWVRR